MRGVALTCSPAAGNNRWNQLLQESWCFGGRAVYGRPRRAAQAGHGSELLKVCRAAEGEKEEKVVFILGDDLDATYSHCGSHTQQIFKKNALDKNNDCFQSVQPCCKAKKLNN